MTEERTARGLVTFIGAGPGDPDLLTLAAARAIAEADLVIWPAALLPRAMTAHAPSRAELVDASPLRLEECCALMRRASLAGRRTARLHVGDPTIFGSLTEQTDILDAAGIPWRVIPGVSAASAAAAAAGASLTLPDGPQSLVVTRLAGRKPMPPGERFADLAAHGAAMAVYLSAHLADDLQKELLAAYPPDTTVICGQRVSLPAQRLVRTTAADLARCVREEGLDHQAVFLVLPGHPGRPGGA